MSSEHHDGGERQPAAHHHEQNKAGHDVVGERTTREPFAGYALTPDSP
jgi:hypothetical protein